MQENIVPLSPFPPEKPRNPLVILAVVFGLALALVFIITGLVLARGAFIAGAQIVGYTVVVLMVIGVPGSLIVAGLLAYQAHKRRVSFAQLELARAARHIDNEDALTRAQVQQLHAHTEVLKRTVSFDEQGNAAILDALGQVQQLRGNMREHPLLTSYHNAPRVTSVAEEKKSEQLQLAAPEGIPAIVNYADVREEVPAGMSLLGIHPSNGDLELADWEKLKMLWIVGSSSTGKSNTVFGKALEAVNAGARLLVIDPHATKEDSLTRKLAPLSAYFLRPVAVTEGEIIDTASVFIEGFTARVDGADCSQKIVLIMDEMNRMARNEHLLPVIREVVAIGGEESRGFGMYVWAISQKAVHLKWLRDSAITVIAHRVTRMEEAMLVCNDDRKAARLLLNFTVGRSFIYGVDFDGLMELQQPLYDASSIVESTVATPSAQIPHGFQPQQLAPSSAPVERNGEADGSGFAEKTTDSDLSVKKILRDIGKRLKKGDSKADILRDLDVKPGRATQEMGAAIDWITEEIEAERAR